jgi:ribosome-associated protein
MTTEGELVILARRFRTQEANRADARQRLSELVDAALVRPEKRIKTKPSKAAKARRVDSKKARATIKAGRGRVSFD